MLSGLMFDYIIINMIRNKSLEFYSDGIDSSSKNIDNNRIYMYRVSLQYYYWEKGTHEIIHVACLHFNVERTKMRQYLTNILKYDTSSDDMKENMDHWLDSFENFHKEYIIMPT